MGEIFYTMHSGVIGRAMELAVPQSLPPSSLFLSLCYFALEVPVLILLPRGIIKWSLFMCQEFVKGFILFN